MATRTITVGTAGVPLDREVGGTDLSTDRTAAEMRTALELGTAAVADADDFATATRTVGTGGAGVSGVSGSGGIGTNNGANAPANRGGGGGGGGWQGASSWAGGNGGSGIVIIRYPGAVT